MEYWQLAITGMYGVLSVAAAVAGYRNVVNKKNVFGLTPQLAWLGIFVWGDAIPIGIFGSLGAALLILINDWYLVLLSWITFWIVRSHGEVIYWINQQFSNIERNPPKSLKGYGIFGNDSIWFIYQLSWQLVNAAAIIGGLLILKKWWYV